MWLRHNLRNECGIVKVLDVEDFPFDPIIICSCLINVSQQVFILEIKFVKFLIVVLAFVVRRWVSQILLIHIFTGEISLKVNFGMHQQQILISIISPVWMLPSLILIRSLLSLFFHFCLIFKICLIFYVIRDFITIIFLIIII